MLVFHGRSIIPDIPRYAGNHWIDRVAVCETLEPDDAPPGRGSSLSTPALQFKVGLECYSSIIFTGDVETRSSPLPIFKESIANLQSPFRAIQRIT